MSLNKITWEQFGVCNNNTQGIKFGFEDLCRQLFIYEFLSKNKSHGFLHSNPNNPGLESDPIYDEVNDIWIGYQVKFFQDTVKYVQIKHSSKKIIEYYSGKVNKIYLFCNKAITSTSNSYIDAISILKENNIEVELITDTMILDLVKKYQNLGLYYFEQHYLNKEWFDKHTQEILSKLGERYNDVFNVDTSSELNLSLFSQDLTAVNYLNSKKNLLLTSLKNLGWRYKDYIEYKEKINNTVNNIEDISIRNIKDAILWDKILKDSVKENLIIFNNEIQSREKEKENLLLSTENINENEIRKKINDIDYNISILEELINIADTLKLKDEEISLLNSKILIVKGKAGMGKSHLLANAAVNLIKNNREVLLLIGSDYLADTPIQGQIMSNMSLEYSFLEMLEILDLQGQLGNYIVPVYIDAINESWNKPVWKNGLPAIFEKVSTLNNIKLVISYRTEYEKVFVNKNTLSKYNICIVNHSGFVDVSFNAIKTFLNYYKIALTPLHMFNLEMTNPLFLTLYCKTYQGSDEVDLLELYDRLLEVANKNMYKNIPESLKCVGYEEYDDVVTPVISELADFIVCSGKKLFSKKDISDLPVWNRIGIASRPFIQQLIKENIIHDYIYEDEEKLFFAYDQMNDCYCAKSILKKFSTKEDAYENIKKIIVENGNIKFENKDMFVYLCALYAEKYGEECIEIIDDINDVDDMNYIFLSYIETFQWRKSYNLTWSKFLSMLKKYGCDVDKIWEIFINNSLKKNNIFNADELHKILIKYDLAKRDYLWTTYINKFNSDSEHRLIQLIEMYNLGNGLEITDKKETELLLTLISWLLTASNRWLRDIASKAMVEILKVHFDLCEVILSKFKDVNDPYVIQRLFGIVWGACMKREPENKESFKSLANYVYENIFNVDFIYPDILLRDYARLIIERYMYEYPEDKMFSKTKITPPYISEPIPQIEDQGYLELNFKDGMHSLINSMKFEGSGWYGDFGRYVFQSALRYFDVDHNNIFNYAIYYIVNYLGYTNELFGEYDSHLGRYDYNRHNTVKIERIGKKYQWITMYNILARVSDYCEKTDTFYYVEKSDKYQGPWDPYVRDFDPTLNNNFIISDKLPNFKIFEENKELYKLEKQININSEEDEKNWVEQNSNFFNLQKSSLVIKDDNDIEWVILTKYEDNKDGEILTGKFQIWNWMYACFVTDEQLKTLKKYSSKKNDLVIQKSSPAPQTYILYNREYPWSLGSNIFSDFAWENIEIPTGKEIFETYEAPPAFKIIDDLFLDETENMEDDNFEKILENKLKNKVIEIIEKKTIKVDETENIGNVLCSAMDLLWEAEYDASKENAISFFLPCKEIIEECNLKYGNIDGAFYDTNNKLATFDIKNINQSSGLIIRKDKLEEFTTKKKMNLVWFVNGAKEIHSENYTIHKQSRWGGLLVYENGKVEGDIYRCKDR